MERHAVIVIHPGPLAILVIVCLTLGLLRLAEMLVTAARYLFARLRKALA